MTPINASKLFKANSHVGLIVFLGLIAALFV